MGSIKLDSLQAIVAGSYQDKIEEFSEYVESTFSDKRLFALYDDHAVLFSDEGKFYSCPIVNGNLGEASIIDIVELDLVDEAICVNEMSRRLMESLIVGDTETFQSGMTELFVSVKPAYLEASTIVNESINHCLEKSKFVEIMEEKITPIRKSLYGSLNQIKEREFKKISLESRHDIIYGLTRIVDRLNESIVLCNLTCADCYDLVSKEHIVLMAEDMNATAKKLSKAVTQKIKLDGNCCEVSELKDTYNSLIEQVNRIDLCSSFIKKVAA